MPNRKFIKETQHQFLLRALSLPPTDECMLWPFQIHHGYGYMHFNPLGRKVAVHRIAYFLTYGEWPEPFGRHTCDTRQCFNPRHVVAGTNVDNIADRIERGTSQTSPIEQAILKKQYGIVADAGKNLYEWLCEQLANHPGDGSCLLWPFSTTAGYGRLYFPETGRNELAHRIAFKLTYGRWPTPCGLHLCDIRLCFLPQHIFEGTREENNADKAAKGREVVLRGIAHGEAKLNENAVREIRRRYDHRNVAQLAREYGVTPGCIGFVVRRQSWKHVL